VDFPILVSFTDNDLSTTANGGNVENGNGFDIIFTLGDCTTELDHKIESYNATTRVFIAWVNIPSLPATTNFGIHMYYGNSSVTTNPSTTNTWNANCNGVWHLHNDFLDGTSNVNNLTNNGSSDLVSMIGDGQGFDGTTRRIYLDGFQINSDSPGGTHNGTNANFAISRNCFTCSSGEFFNGTIDEVKISNTARSADWIATEFNNQNSPSTFYTGSAEMTATNLCATLPIELLNFNITYQKDDQKVFLDWQTASELNNEFFTIERSINGNDWEEINKIDGAGNSSSLLSYWEVDNNPHKEISYYRLNKQILMGNLNIHKYGLSILNS